MVICIIMLLKLVNTTYIPSIRRNLVSTSILDKCGFTFSFRNGKVTIYYDSVVVGSGILFDSLYKIHLSHSLTHCTSNSLVVNVIIGSKCGRINEKSLMLWHKRLGHISRHRIEKLIKDDILVELEFSNFETCVDCIKE